MIKIIYLLIGCITLGLIVSAGAASAQDTASAPSDVPVVGNYTQKQPCKGDGSDPPELKVTISPQGIDSKMGPCTFLDHSVDGKKFKAQIECKLPAGLLMSDITFTMKTDNIIEFVDRDQTYKATLYRCPQ
ncbi:MAG: hypothetical protein P4L80_05605 [Xanthobacteraceae bacterium]|nr:hypothetical protein [Xanthobacteraceae bacterium]